MRGLSAGRSLHPADPGGFRGHVEQVPHGDPGEHPEGQLLPLAVRSRPETAGTADVAPGKSQKRGPFHERNRGDRLLRRVLRDLPGVSEHLQGLQDGVSGRFPGPEPGKMQDEEVLSGQRPCHLRELRRIRPLRGHPILSQPPWLQIRQIPAGAGIHPHPRPRRLPGSHGALDRRLRQVPRTGPEMRSEDR